MTGKTPAPDAEAAPDPRRWLALAVLLVGALLPPLDFSIVNLALPSIQADLGASPGEVQFVISAYAATYAVFLITGGRLGDLFGRRRLFTIGIAGFTLASLLCAAAWSPGALIAGRILQGVAATAMAPQVLASIRVMFPGTEQGLALGLYGATFSLAFIIGQVMGGVLISLHPFGLGWQAIFLVNLPIGLAGLAGARFFLVESRAPTALRLDLVGVALLSLTLALLVYPLVEGRQAGWPVWCFALLVAAPIALAAFIGFEARLTARGGSPLVDLALFRERDFVIGLAAALSFYMLSSFYLTFSVYQQGGLHRSTLQAGLAILPFLAGVFASSFAASTGMRLLGPRVLTLGFAAQILGFGADALAVAGAGPAIAFDAGLVVAGLGYGLVLPSAIKVVIGGVAARQAGLASGIVISVLQIGAALGVAIIGGVFYAVLGPQPDAAAHGHAFAVALGGNVALLGLGAVLSLMLRRPRATVAPATICMAVSAE
jgi:EmrB/QacA subfamily drug resistance transporter